MKTSEFGRALLKRREGVRYSPYKDTNGFWTCGVGCKMNREPLPNEVWSEEFVDNEFSTRLEEFERAVNGAVTQPMTQPQFDAFVCLAYNIGGHAFAGSSVVREFQAGNLAAAAQDFLLWHDHGNAAARRAEEMHVFNYGTVKA